MALLLVAVLAASCMVCFLPAASGAKTITVPTDYATVNEAITNANYGDTIVVKNGVYTEQTIEINKTLTLRAENVGGAQIMLHPPQEPRTIFTSTFMVYVNCIVIEADDVTLTGFKIASDGGGISATGNRLTISNNQVGANIWAISVKGDNCITVGNTVPAVNLRGDYQQLSGNQLQGITVTGSHNKITENNGRYLEINGSYNVACKNVFGLLDYNGGNAAGILVLSGNHNYVANNTVTNQGTGIAVGYTAPGGSYNVFVGNRVQESHLWGVLMANGSYNVFFGNLIANNVGDGHDGYGLALGGNHLTVNSNLFFRNILKDNTLNFGVNWDIEGSNSFDNGAEGNYWSDYLTQRPTVKEVGNTGIGDQPYTVHYNIQDNYPYIKQPEVSLTLPTLPEPWNTLIDTSIIPEMQNTASIESTPSPTQNQNSNQQPTTPENPELTSTSPTQEPNQYSAATTTPTPDDLPKPAAFSVVEVAVVVVVLVLGCGLFLAWKKRGAS